MFCFSFVCLIGRLYAHLFICQLKVFGPVVVRVDFINAAFVDNFFTEGKDTVSYVKNNTFCTFFLQCLCQGNECSTTIADIIDNNTLAAFNITENSSPGNFICLQVTHFSSFYQREAETIGNFLSFFTCSGVRGNDNNIFSGKTFMEFRNKSILTTNFNVVKQCCGDIAMRIIDNDLVKPKRVDDICENFDG
ncbi:hypothetical protein [Klebsiella phage DP]|nr:hypothetical protein [Klebsiella phage DP]